MDASEGPRKQATTHINVKNEEVATSTGEDRQKWLDAGKKEINNLTAKNRTTTRWSSGANRSSRKGQIEKQSHNRRISVHGIACESGMDHQA